MRALVRFSRVKSIEHATHIKVIPHALTGSREIIPLERKTVDNEEQITFSFRKLHFEWNSADFMFRLLPYPTKLTFAEYRRSSGYGSDAQVKAALERWGPNKFEVPMPTFRELLGEQLVAPFFCFQVFCVALWALDDYWYYSLLTLFMLIAFESTVVQQRLRNLGQVRSLQQPRQPLKVYRRGQWTEVSGESIVPGDVVSLARQPGTDETIVQADMLLVAGTCIVDEAVLTGESTPQWKNPIGEAVEDEIDASILSPNTTLSIKRHRMHVVFGGTKLLQTSRDDEAHLRTPDGGCLAVVLRTGFGTAQGRLMRTILYSTERVTANNLETFAFILFLLLWAVAASAYVLFHGLEDPNRDRFKLLLNCVMILTSVVPPELPMELTIAVNASIVALATKKIFCTEPFRIPLAGKITTCCFDKTGTLTSDHMVLEGVAGLHMTKRDDDNDSSDGGAQSSSLSERNDSLLTDAKRCPPLVMRVLACCQSLIQVDGAVVGDPVERAAVEATKWNVRGDVVTGASSSGRENITILHRFHFSSSLKRMSVVVKVEGSGVVGSPYWVLAKGAPETIEKYLHVVPDGYEKEYRRYAAEGARVLSLAAKPLPAETTPSSLRHTTRDDIEDKLTFVGFAIFRAPVRPDSEPSLQMLRESQHQLVMITGDAPLTACHTARHVCIMTRQPLILFAHGPPNAWKWRSPDGSQEEEFDFEPKAAFDLAQAYDLCLTGDALLRMSEADPDALPTFIPLTSVFARVTPEQKEIVIKTLRSVGLSVLMCGDGTNDVGALKGAHVGVALLPPPEKLQMNSANGDKDKGKKDRRKTNREVQGNASSTTGPGAKYLADLRRRGVRVTSFHERLACKMDEMSHQMGGLDEPQMVRPGDASMASPFTAKDPSVAPCLDVLRQGRAALVTTVQMFKILGLLSLSTAYSLSVLYLDGIKLGDMQATLAGLLTAGMFFFISNARPLEQLSRERPHSKIFSLYMFSSLLGQFACHMAFLMYMQNLAHALMLPEERQEPGAEFKPNLVNTVCFLANFAIQTMTFAVNYVGKPFTTPLAENKLFALSVRWSVAMFVLLTTDIIPGLTGWFSLVPLPSQMKIKMLMLAWSTYLMCNFIERGARKAFPAALPPEKGGYTSSR